MRKFFFVVLFSALAAGSACGSTEEEPTESADPEPTAPVAEVEEPEAPPAAEPTPPDESAAPRAETEEYIVELQPQEGYSAGELGQFALHLEGQGEWHLNQDFPFSVTVSHADGLQLPKTALAKSDATSFADEGADFDVPFTPAAAGEHPVSARVEFAVCNPESCVPRTAVVGLRIAVAE